MTLTLALSLVGNLIVALFILLCVALILIILLQKGRGGGLGAAFGGGGAGSLLGTKTGDFLTWVTISLVAGFLVLAVLMGKFMRPSGSDSTLSTPAAPVKAPVTDIKTDAEEAVNEATDAVVVDEVEAVDAAVVEEAAENTAEEVTAEPATETTE
ncbi:MAG: preprotein translocase subunit SecG [Planctomycetota bacterium]|jgi:preprotein translocase subunit SecG